jgi:hypothetical protein
MMHLRTSLLTPSSAEDSLRPIIKYWIVELMDCGGTNPSATCEVVAEEEPDLYKAVGGERVLALCQELHRLEDLVLSDWYGVKLRLFDKKYFDGRLRGYRVRAVYDIWLWICIPFDHFRRSYVDLAGRQIFVEVTQCGGFSDMERHLIHNMAHAATVTTSDDDVEWQREMKRLSELGAPVFG